MLAHVVMISLILNVWLFYHVNSDIKKQTIGSIVTSCLILFLLDYFSIWEYLF